MYNSFWEGSQLNTRLFVFFVSVEWEIINGIAATREEATHNLWFTCYGTRKNKMESAPFIFIGHCFAGLSVLGPF